MAADLSHDHNGARFTASFLRRLHPALPAGPLAAYERLIIDHDVQIGDIPALGHSGLEDLGIVDPVHRARLLAAATGDVRSDPPRVAGKPVEVQVKLGFSLLGSVDTVNQTAFVKFFLDLYWNDPAMVGVDPSNVPPYIWRPDAYVFNAVAGCTKHAHPPVLLEPTTGLMLHAIAFECNVDNPMDLRQFPFDADSLTISIIQEEGQSTSDYVFVPWKGDVENSFKLFFDHTTVPEWEFRGFSVDPFVTLGGNGVEYAHVLAHIHLKRRSSFYMWKIFLPLFLSTVICFSAFFFEPDNLSDRSNISLTMFLATAALLFVIGSLLPKTSFLTMIDRFVVINLGIQFAVVVTSWILAEGFGPVGNVDKVDKTALIVIPILYFASVVLEFFPPIIRSALITETTRPPYPCDAWNSKQPLPFYPFKVGHNVFV